MLKQFTAEEINLMCIFDRSNRDALISDLRGALPDFDEPELREIAENVLGRLSDMSAGDFAAMELCPEYMDYDDESEA